MDFLVKMASLLLFSLGLYVPDTQGKLVEYSQHPSYAGHVFNFSTLTPVSLLNEYITIVCHTAVFGTLLYFILSCSSYLFFFISNKAKFLPALPTKDFKILHDIKWSLLNIWFESFLVAVIRMLIPRYSFIYFSVSDWPLWVLPLSVCFHVVWDETLTYWTHRFLHTYRELYLRLHIVHHRSISITPFAGFAFHPVDAFMQALPMFTSCFFFPLHYDLFLIFSVMTTCWAISIHDNVPALPCKLFLYATHHTIHHERGQGSFKNYGKFTSVWDRLMGSYEDPDRIDFGWTSKITVFDRFNASLSRWFDNKFVAQVEAS